MLVCRKILNIGGKMKKIVPSKNREELMTQLYVFRGMLGDLYQKAETYQKGVNETNQAIGGVELVNKEVQYLQSLILTDIKKTKQHKSFMISTGIILSVIAIGISIAMLLLGAFEKSFWFLIIPAFILILWLPMNRFLYYHNSKVFYSNHLDNMPTKIEDMPVKMGDFMKYNLSAYIDSDGTIKNIGTRFAISENYGKKNDMIPKYHVGFELPGRLYLSDIVVKITMDDYNLFVKTHPDLEVVKKIGTLTEHDGKRYVNYIKGKYSNTRVVFDTQLMVCKRAFSNFLIESDWEKVDTLIYLISSRRADTLKEALLGADTVIRHEQIVTGLNDIKQAIDTQTNVMTECTKALLMGMNEINNSIQQVAQSIDSLSECIAMSAAAIASTINVSSREMCARIGVLSNQLY